MLGRMIHTGSVRWLAVGLAVGLSVGLIGSVAYASIPGTGGAISACVANSQLTNQNSQGQQVPDGQHAVTLLDAAQNAACQAGQTLITWSQTGPQGPAGPQGATGPTGATGATGPQGALVLRGLPVPKVQRDRRGPMDRLARPRRDQLGLM
jgi:hypothetical protein